MEMQALSAPNRKLQIASDFKSRRPNRKNFPQIASKDAQITLSNRAICDLRPFQIAKKLILLEFSVSLENLNLA